MGLGAVELNKFTFKVVSSEAISSCITEDNQWYRAKVLAYSSEDRVCVGYIDFGNSEEVELTRLRPINKDLLALATQAIPCSLAGIIGSAYIDLHAEIFSKIDFLINMFILLQV